MRADSVELDAANSEGVGRARRIAFNVVVVVFILMHLVLSPLPFAVLGWFLEAGAISHRIHEICFGLVFVVSAVGLLAQLRNPAHKVAAMYQVIIPLYLIMLSVLLIDRDIDPVVFAFIVFPIVLILLHPARGRVLRPDANPSAVLLAITALAVIPALVYAADQVGEGVQASKLAPAVLEELPDTATDEQVEAALAAAAGTSSELEAVQHFGHWSAMGAFAVSVLGLGITGSVRIEGWRLPAWAAAVSAIVLGVASLVAAGDASALSGAWAIAAIAWGLAYAGATEYVHRNPAQV